MRENSTLPPKPRAEGSNPSAPAIGKKSVDALQQGVYGVFLCHNCEIGHALKIPDNRGRVPRREDWLKIALENHSPL